MAHIAINQNLVSGKAAELAALCPFGAIEVNDGKLDVTAGCRMCRLCIKKGGGVFELVEDTPQKQLDKSLWQGIAVIAEIENGNIHPVTFELLGKARELAAKVNFKVYALMIGSRISELGGKLIEYGADELFIYDQPELEHFRIEPYTAAVEDFINMVHPSSILVGGTPAGRSLAPRIAARFRTGLTADCTKLDISPETDLDQIRPAYGGNIMAHINTPHHRPQFATVRYKIFSIPAARSADAGVVHHCQLPESKLHSAINITGSRAKSLESGIEEAEVLVAAGRGVRKQEDLDMLRELAGLLGGQLASTRALVEAGWCDAKQQIGLSGRTVKPKLLIACGVSGAIQFAAGMNNSEKIIAINADPEAPIFKIAHIGIHGDLYRIVPELIRQIKEAKNHRG